MQNLSTYLDVTLNPSYRNAWRIAEQFPGMKGLIIFGILLEEGKKMLGINPLTPMSDQDRIAPYNIKTISIRRVMRMRKNINLRTIILIQYQIL